MSDPAPKASTYLIDTNLIVRVIVDDPPDQAAAAAALFDEAARTGTRLRLTAAVVAECFYVLTSYYQMQRSEAAEMLTQVVSQPSLAVDGRPALLQALQLAGHRRQKFVDCYLAALAVVDKQGVATQDRCIEKLADMPVLYPPDRQKDAQP